MVLVVERQSAAHHLIHHYPQTPPVHSTAIVVVFQHLGDDEGGKHLFNAAGGMLMSYFNSLEKGYSTLYSLIRHLTVL